MKTVKTLLDTTHSRTMGNHRIRINSNFREFAYHNTVICVVIDSTRTYNVNNGGWGTSSTTRAINAYVRELEGMGYTRDENIKAGYRF